MRDENGSLGNLEHLLIGGLSGCIAKTAIAPFDRVKIHFQVATPEFRQYNRICLHCLPVESISGVFRSVHKVFEMQGIRGLFQGHSLTLLRIFPYAAINFYTYDWLKRNVSALMGRGHHDVPVYWRFPLGSASGFFLCVRVCVFTVGLLAVVTTYPIDVVRARLAFRIGQKRMFSPRAELVSYFASMSSVASLYRGFLPTALGMSIYSGASFFTFDSLDMCARSHFDGGAPGWSKFVSGFVAGISAQTLSYPFDVLRRRMQIYHIAPHLQGNAYSALKMAASIYRNEGILAFWRGLSINFIKVAPATGLSFYCYNMLKNAFERLSLHQN